MELIDLKDASQKLQEEAWQLFLTSFPDHERWGKDAFERASADTRYHTKLAIDKTGELLAILYYWIFDHMLYVEFLAVNPAMRGKNIGTLLIEKLISGHPDYKIILEIDPPIDQISIRRLHFYERLRFVPNDHEHIHPSYISGERAFPHLLVMMSHKEPMTTDEFRQFLLGVLEAYGD